MFERDAGGADALSRPTSPYISVDRGFGHNGYPAMSISVKGARAFCAWLTRKTGRVIRLPSYREWSSACELPVPSHLGEAAWFAGNSDGVTHPVGSRLANRWGLLDMLGNVAEWCEGVGGPPVVAGGSFRDTAKLTRPDTRVRPSPAWNASDPQIPKSPWWLADAPFVGFRIACEAEPASR